MRIRNFRGKKFPHSLASLANICLPIARDEEMPEHSIRSSLQQNEAVQNRSLSESRLWKRPSNFNLNLKNHLTDIKFKHPNNLLIKFTAQPHPAADPESSLGRFSGEKKVNKMVYNLVNIYNIHLYKSHITKTKIYLYAIYFLLKEWKNFACICIWRASNSLTYRKI